MDEVISLLQFRTAIPFGYLLFAMIWLVSGVWVVVVIAQMLWTRRLRAVRLFLALGLLTLSSAYVYANFLFEEYLDMNPVFSEGEVVGTWVDGGSSFTLLENHEAILKLSRRHAKRLNLANGSGAWRKVRDFNIRLNDGRNGNGSGGPPLRVISFHGTYRIIIYDYVDPDMWDGHLGFKREKSSG